MMKISIKYCAQWNYRPRASRLGDELKRELNADVELVAGSGGVFDITANGRQIFSKGKSRRFPDPDEIIALIRAMWKTSGQYLS